MASVCQDATASTSTTSTASIITGPRGPEASPARPSRADAIVAARNGTALGPLVLLGGQEEAARQTLRRLLEAADYRVIEATTGRDALAMMSDDVDVLVVNLTMRDLSARDCLRWLKSHHFDAPVLVISRMGDVPEVVTVMKEGAFECFTRTCHPEQLLARVRDAARLARLAKENRGLKHAVDCPTTNIVLAGKSPTMMALRQQIETFARLDSSVLIIGAPGTGKTTVARWMHGHSPRAEGPCVLVHCGTVPRDVVEAELFGQASGDVTCPGQDRPGRAELADGGTLLLEEVGEMPAEAQIRLVHLLQDRVARRIGSDAPRRLDVRVIATTSQDPAMLCRQGCLRDDLLFRIDVLSLRMPALKDHIDDLPEIASGILLRIARRRGCPAPELAPDALDMLGRYPWPGNTRELESILERAFTLSQGATITRTNLPQLQGSFIDRELGATSEPGLAGFTLAEIERRAIIDTMHACAGNKAKTARRLGVSEKTIYNKIKQYNLRGSI